MTKLHAMNILSIEVKIMWNKLIKTKLLEEIECRQIEGETLSRALGREKSWYAQFKTNRRKRLDLDTDVMPILHFLQIDEKRFLMDVILEK